MSKFIGLIGLVLGLSVLFSTTVYAEENRMMDLFIHLELHEDGSGTVTEHRQMDMNRGTELFITMDNLNGSVVSGFEVEGFNYTPIWDSDESFDEKANYYGIIRLDDGDVELVWGISEYGNNEYTLTYTISDMVRRLEDGQAIFWNFDSYGDILPENLTIEVDHPEGTLSEDVNVWGFGFEGDSNYEGNTVFYESHEAFSSGNHPTILIQYPTETFSTSMREDMTLAEQEEMATDGAEGYNPRGSSSGIWRWFLYGGIGLFMILFVGGMFIERAVGKGNRLSVPRIMKDNKHNKYELEPYTDGDMADIAWILQQTGLGRGSFDAYFKAYLLKWAKEERIHIESEEVKSFFGKKYESTITIQNFEEQLEKFPLSFIEMIDEIIEGEEQIPYEVGVWTMLLDAADGAGVVTHEDVAEWAKDHAEDVQEYAEHLEEYSKEVLQDKGIMKESKERMLGIDFPIIEDNPEMIELTKRVVQFERYLAKLSLKGEDSLDQPLDWEDLLIWATLFNKSDALVKQIEDFYPEQWASWVDDYPYYYGGYYGYTGFTTSYTSGLSAGGYNPSGGAGGSVSSGGGGGASGGGGGGAR